MDKEGGGGRKGGRREEGRKGGREGRRAGGRKPKESECWEGGAVFWQRMILHV